MNLSTNIKTSIQDYLGRLWDLSADIEVELCDGIDVYVKNILLSRDDSPGDLKIESLAFMPDMFKQDCVNDIQWEAERIVSIEFESEIADMNEDLEREMESEYRSHVGWPREH